MSVKPLASWPLRAIIDWEIKASQPHRRRGQASASLSRYRFQEGGIRSTLTPKLARSQDLMACGQCRLGRQASHAYHTFIVSSCEKLHVEKPKRLYL
jgi:hypothetical protein